MSKLAQDIYYVYLYLRDHDSPNGPKGSPYYVGKGKNSRIIAKHNVRIPKDPVNRVKIAENLSEEVAHQIEKVHIAIWGRLDLGTGILRNYTNGGEGATGYKLTDTQKEKRRQTNSRPEVKLRRSESGKEVMSRPDVRSRRDKSLTEANLRPEVRARRSNAKKEHMSSPEARASISAALKQTLSRPEVRAARSLAQKEAQNRADVKLKHQQGKIKAIEKQRKTNLLPEVKARKSAAQKEAQNRPEVIANRRAKQQAIRQNPLYQRYCEHCYQTVFVSTYTRFHGPKCRLLCG